MLLRTTRQPDLSMFFRFIDMIRAIGSPRQHDERIAPGFAALQADR
jgi:hypothetical protein